MSFFPFFRFSQISSIVPMVLGLTLLFCPDISSLLMPEAYFAKIFETLTAASPQSICLVVSSKNWVVAAFAVNGRETRMADRSRRTVFIGLALFWFLYCFMNVKTSVKWNITKEGLLSIPIRINIKEQPWILAALYFNLGIAPPLEMHFVVLAAFRFVRKVFVFRLGFQEIPGDDDLFGSAAPFCGAIEIIEEPFVWWMHLPAGFAVQRHTDIQLKELHDLVFHANILFFCFLLPFLLFLFSAHESPPFEIE